MIHPTGKSKRPGRLTRRRYLWLPIAALTVATAPADLAAASGSQATPTSQAARPPSTRPTTRTVTSRPGDPTVERDDNEALTRLRRSVEEADSPIARTRAALAAARQTLISDTAPALSCLLLGRDDCASELARRARWAHEFLDQATAALQNASTDLGPDSALEIEDRIDMLRGFQRLFAALARPTPGPKDTDALLDACSDLAIYLDEANSGVVESARLWQGLAYRRAGRPQRAAQILRPSLTPPAFARIGLHARLQRCLALGDADMHVAGLSLCLRLRARLDDWFDPQTDKQATDQARLAVRWTRIRLLRSWASTLRESGKQDRARQADQRADALAGDDPFPPGRGSCLELTAAIAGLVDSTPLDAAPASRPAGDSAPATDDEPPAG